MQWNFAHSTACDLVLKQFEQLNDNEKKKFESWLNDAKALTLEGQIQESALKFEESKGQRGC